jgi:hypothetical protein
MGVFAGVEVKEERDRELLDGAGGRVVEERERATQ